MYAIIKSGSRQYQVQPESIITVNRLPLESGAAFETDQVLLCADDGAVQVGTPYVAGATVRGRVLEHKRGTKVLIFKHKRRKNYRRTRGHRQELSRVLIETIEVGGKTHGAPIPPKAKPAPKARAEAAPEAAEATAEGAAKTAAKPKAAAKAAPKADKAKAAKPKAKAPAKAAKPKASAAKGGASKSAKASASKGKGGKATTGGRSASGKSGAKRTSKDKASKD